MRHHADLPSSPVSSHLHGGASFEDALREHLRTAPWLAVSGLFHAALFLVLAQFPWSAARAERPEVVLVAAAPEPDVDPFEPPEIPPPPDKIEIVKEDPIDDPVVSEDDIDNLVETESDLQEALAEAPFDGKGMNDVLGVGGGGGGPRGGGGKYSRRGQGSKSAGHETVERALEWLAHHQSSRGYWSAAGFSDECRTNRCDGPGDTVHDVGVTGLALLAFLGAGHSPSHGKYRATVKDGLRYLTQAQDAETGCFGEPNSHTSFLYDHALATLAMTEGYGLSGWPILKEPAQKGVNFIHAARKPYGAWRYEYPSRGNEDTSMTGWMVMALKSADDFGLKADHAALDDAHTFLDRMTDDQSWRTGYTQRGSYSAREEGFADRWPEQKTEALTAVAMLCRVFLGEDPGKSPALRGGADLLRKQLPLWDEKEGTIDFYYWYYGSYAMYQMGGRDWESWSRPMLDAVVKTQRRDGDEAGSWDPQFDPWGHRGGRVYSTAIMALTLEVYYRYDRVLGAR